MRGSKTELALAVAGTVVGLVRSAGPVVLLLAVRLVVRSHGNSGETFAWATARSGRFATAGDQPPPPPPPPVPECHDVQSRPLWFASPDLCTSTQRR